MAEGRCDEIVKLKIEIDEVAASHVEIARRRPRIIDQVRDARGDWLMVYGLNVKPEWGYYPKVETLDGDLSKASAIITPDGGVGTGGFPRETESLPKRVKWKDPNGNPVPDFDTTPMLNVSERARQLIESLEPGLHQFVPVEYVDRKGKFLENRYWFAACKRIDSLDREHTTMVLAPRLGWYPASDLVAVGIPIPIVSPHVV